MICSFGAILAWKSDDADDADNDDNDRKSDPYMSPSYAGDTINCGLLEIGLKTINYYFFPTYLSEGLLNFLRASNFETFLPCWQVNTFAKVLLFHYSMTVL